MRSFLKVSLVGGLATMIGLNLMGCRGFGAEPTPVARKGYIEYVGSTFTLQVPTRWRHTSNPQFQVLFLAPEEAGFNANLGISIEPVGEEATVEMIAEAAREFQSRDYSQYLVINEGTLTVGGKPTFKRTYSWHSDEHDIDVTQVQLFVKDGSTLYTLTATSLTSNYDQYKGIFAEVMDSFQVSG